MNTGNKMKEFWKVKERWVNVEGYENYMVSNYGNIVSLGNHKSRKDKMLKPLKDKKGYLMVVLSKDGKQKRFLLHRLVAMAWIQNPENRESVDHFDGDKTNNCILNLSWMNNEDNLKKYHTFKKWEKKYTGYKTKDPQ
ncbi:hypothetical protein QFZ31_005740 [Neobacillus niacini]|uniref:NUMOD4 domain-containing protein n=1 Tax=Neobacillus driksii TaxID=3035913 RepID=UPI00278619E1|nr:NUMOD4 domain-containing protein [Neobacillus niacini]MDQ0975862.1 hypothetical protein [Neobacillus niacini]